MKIQILISKNSWANKYKKYIISKLNKLNKKIIFLDNHKKLKKNFHINIIFSYFRKIDYKYLKYSKHNLLVHESNLPKGRGMSPLTWQLLKGKKNITFSLLEADEGIDKGKIYFKKKIFIKETALFEEIKKIQLDTNIKLLLKFLKYYLKFRKPPGCSNQTGKPSYYKKRTPKDSMINLNKNLKSQINLLRVCDYIKYPAYFIYRRKKIYIRLFK